MLIVLALVIYLSVSLHQCVNSRSAVRLPEVGDIVRVVCNDPESPGLFVAGGEIVLVDNVVSDEWQIAGWIPCGTLVAMRDIRKGEGYFVVPVDKALPSGWILHTVARDDLKFE
jgi:hypothetical protein